MLTHVLIDEVLDMGDDKAEKRQRLVQIAHETDAVRVPTAAFATDLSRLSEAGVSEAGVSDDETIDVYVAPGGRMTLAR